VFLKGRLHKNRDFYSEFLRTVKAFGAPKVNDLTYMNLMQINQILYAQSEVS